MESRPNNLDLHIFNADSQNWHSNYLSEDTSVVQFVHSTLLAAIQRGASDIHFEPFETGYRIRFRQDGILKEESSPPLSLANRISSRLKIMAHLDISERRMPQDGHFSITLACKRLIDFRVSTCPTSCGEKVVLRILSPDTQTLDLENLGLNPLQKENVLNAIHKPQGMILVTGPTGSGKTMTLYSALHKLNTKAVNIVTIEDPIEMKIPGISQVNVNPRIGLTMVRLMQAFLRQDPDIIMLGEIRSLETAKMAREAAETGHLVLSTLHTNSASETLRRLIHLGLPSCHIADTINLIIAQRLVRKLCIVCKVVHADLSAADYKYFGELREVTVQDKIYKPQGCANCTDGYQGRVGIFEVMPLSKTILDLLLQDAQPDSITKQAEKEGMLSLYQAGVEKIRAGITSIAEVRRVCARI